MRPNTASVKTVRDCAWRVLISLQGNIRGATAIEYGLILALIVLGMMTGLVFLADGTSSLWKMLNTRVANAR